MQQSRGYDYGYDCVAGNKGADSVKDVLSTVYEESDSNVNP